MFALVSFSFSQIPPNLLSPSNKDSCQSLFVTLDWEAVPNAVLYRVEVSDTNNFMNIIILQNDIEGTELSIMVNNWQKIYYWRVFSIFPGGTEGKSEEWMFKTKRPPILLVSIPDSVKCLDTALTFKWRKADAEFYTLEVASDTAFTNLVVNKNNLTDTAYTANLPYYSQSFFWRVAARKSVCQTDWSERRYFTIKHPAPKLLLPAKGSFGGDIFQSAPFNTTLKWQRDTNAFSYDLQVSLSSTFANIFYENTILGDTLHHVAIGTIYDTTIYWRVRTNTADCQSYWSETFSFKTPYPKPILTLPLNNELCVSLKNNLFKWTVVPNATKYSLQISDMQDFSNILDVINNISETEISYLLSLPLKKHYWRIAAHDSRNSGLWSDLFEFSSTQRPPNSFFPNNNSVGSEKFIIFSWENFGADTKYDLKLSTNDDFSNVLIDTVLLDTNHINVIVPDNNAIYYWMVRVRSGACVGDWSEIQSFKTILPSPQLRLPADNDLISSSYPIFSWYPVEDALSYDLEVSLDSNFAVIYKKEKHITSDTWTFAGEAFQEQQTYFWRLLAENNEGRSHWSNFFRFTTKQTPPEAPILIYPANGATKVELQLEFKWHKFQNANLYQLQIATDKDFLTPLAELQLADTSYSVTGLNLFTNYFWRLKAFNQGGEGNWSQTFSFRTKDVAPTDIVALVFPEEAATGLPLTFTFTWNSIPNVLGYEIAVASSPDFAESSIVLSAPQVWVNKKLIYGLEYNKEYFWQVRGWNEAGNAPWSTVRSFKTLDITSVENNDPYISDVIIAPNPVDKNFANIKFELKTSSYVALKVYNLLGKEVLNFNKNYFAPGINNIELKTNNLKPGVYIYNLLIENNIYSGSFIIK